VDVVVAVRQGDRTAAGLVAAVAAASGSHPVVVHTAAEVELALRSRGRDLLVADPDIAALGQLPRSSPGADAPGFVGWLPARSSAKAAELLDAGADEVLDASMVVAELNARLERVIRLRAGGSVTQPAAVGGLRVDARLHQASWQDRALALTPREMEVLQVLVARAGTTVSRDAIYRQVWRWAMPRGDRTVDVNIKRLRSKLADEGVPVEIVTHPGVGYRLGVPESVEHEVVTEV
jgi:DNA-binding response OmpR family regulator